MTDQEKFNKGLQLAAEAIPSLLKNGKLQGVNYYVLESVVAKSGYLIDSDDDVDALQARTRRSIERDRIEACRRASLTYEQRDEEDRLARQAHMDAAERFNNLMKCLGKYFHTENTENRS